MSEYNFGNLFIRPNELAKYVLGHKHNFDHGTFAKAGWILVQMLDDDFNIIKQTQIISKEYKRTHDLISKYEPNTIKLPYHVPSINPLSPWGSVVLLGKDDFITDLATPIPHRPKGDRVLIGAGVMHAIWALSEGAAWDCIYSHRDAQGNITQKNTGWEEAYR
jgi:hypothetical protein